MSQLPKRRVVVLLCLALAAATFIAYESVRRNDFVNFDDNLYITDNEMVNVGLTGRGFVWAFTCYHAHNWHPVTWLSHMLDCSWFGLNPAGHHLMNVLFHAGNAVLLLLLLYRWTGRLWPSAFVAAVFALHPTHVESVAWASERKDVLSTFFLMLTLWAYTAYVVRPGFRRYSLVGLMFALGLMSKQMLVTVPLLLLLLDYWPLKRLAGDGTNTASASLSRCIYEKLPLLVLALAASFIVYAVQEQSGVVKTSEEYALPYRFGNALVAYFSYIEKTIWPVDLTIFYPHPGTTLPLGHVAAAAIALLGTSVLAIYFGRKYRFLAVGWFWYLISLVPVLGLVQVGMQSIADRYLYIPSIGLLIIVAWGVSLIALPFPRSKVLLGGTALIVLAVLSVATHRQCSHWRNSITLYGHGAVVIPNNWWAYNALGVAYDNENRLEEAAELFRRALSLKSNLHHTHVNLGKILIKLGDAAEAEEYLRQAVELQANFADAHLYLGVALAEQDRLDEATAHMMEAVRLDPQSVPGRVNLSEAFERQGNLDQAVMQLEQALQIAGDSATLRQRLQGLRQQQDAAEGPD